MKKKTLMIAACVTVAGTMATTGPAQAASTFYFNANQQYKSAAASPFAGTAGLILENFEDGKLNTFGVKANAGGFVKGPSSGTDSVDFDDGKNDGWGRQGRSYSSGTSKVLTFTFKQDGQGRMPSMAGLVWTDGQKSSKITFRAWDSYGTLLGKIVMTLGDLARNGGTAEDRFMGVSSTNGISRIQVVSNFAGFEIDHLQYTYGFAVVPVPPALALGGLGLMGVMVMKWRRGVKSNAADRRSRLPLHVQA